MGKHIGDGSVTCNKGENCRSGGSRVDNDGRPMDVCEGISQKNVCTNDVQTNIPASDGDRLLDGRPKRGRRRKYEHQDRDTRNKCCIQNRGYFTQRNVFKEPTAFRHYLRPCICLENVGEDNAKKGFDAFYSVESHDAQRALICSMVSAFETQRKRVKTSNKRTFSRL